MTVKWITRTDDRVSIHVELWTGDVEDSEPVFDYLADELGIGRKVIEDIECDETNIEWDGEGNHLASYTIRIAEGGIEL